MDGEDRRAARGFVLRLCAETPPPRPLSASGRGSRRAVSPSPLRGGGGGGVLPLLPLSVSGRGRGGGVLFLSPSPLQGVSVFGSEVARNAKGSVGGACPTRLRAAATQRLRPPGGW